MTESQFAIAIGNPADGFTYVGPFVDYDVAQAHAEEMQSDNPWWIISLESPNP